MNKLKAEIKNGALEYSGIPFWSWNDRLEAGELRRQIRNMKDLGTQGFFMHARGGLETEYLSDEWFECVRTCVEEANELGMQAWGYDENGWPSGFAGGKLLEDPENHAVFVFGEFTDTYPERAENTIAVYAFDENGVPFATEAPVESSRYLSVKKGTDSSYVDTLREDITDKFIEATHKEYQRRFGEDLGTSAMPGFFTDEPQYYRSKTPFSNKMEEWFFDEYGYSVKDALPALFCDYDSAKQYRYDYWRLAAAKFTSGFSKRIFDWAEENGVQITGHFIDEESLRGQMTCCGDIMPQYLYEHIPGIDYLTRNMRTDLAIKQLGSVCAQIGRKKAISEMFAMCGWDVSPRELKHIAELQYAGGVNVMCHHLYPYSIRGQRKRDYPAFYSEHNLWQDDLKSFNSYFNNLGYMLAMGTELADVLVIHPMHSAWLTFKRDDPTKTSVKFYDDNLISLTYLLSGNQIAYHFGSETIMKDMASVQGSAISVGLCKYHTVVIPVCDTLDAKTVELLKQFKDNGGKIYTYNHHLPSRIDGRPADLSFLEGCEDISDAPVFDKFRRDGEVVVTHVDNVEKGDIRMMVRNTEYGKLIYVTNLTNKEFRGLKVEVKNCERLGKMDIATLDVSALAGRRTEAGVEVLLDLVDSEAVILCEYDAPAFAPFAPSDKPECITLSGEFVTEKITDNLLTLDRAYLSLDGGEFSELRPIERIRDNLLRDRFDGNITLAFPFGIRDIPERLEIITEPMPTDTIAVNGVEVKIGEDWAIDRSFRVTDIAPYVKEGENRIEISIRYWQRDYVYYALYDSMTETLRNCLVFDTELENIYLRGSFALDMKRDDFTEEENNAYCYDPSRGMTLIKQKDNIDVTNIVTDGYPFYAGKLSISTKLNYKAGDPTLLHLTGRYSTAHVSVNGTHVGSAVLSEYVELKDFLREGENTLAITLCGNYRNLLGPHHYKIAETFSVSPVAFSMEKHWKQGECDSYVSRYAFVRFGIDRNDM